MKNRLAISLLCLDNIKKIDFFLDVIHRKKIRFIELPITKISRDYSFNIKKLTSYKELFNKYEIQISSIQSIFYQKENLNIFNKKDHNKIINHLKKVFKIANFLNAKNIIFGSPKNRYYHNNLKDLKVLESIYVNFFQKISDLALKYRLKICLEPNAKLYNCNFVNNLKQAIKVVKKVKRDNFLINADTGNYSLEKDTYIKDRDLHLFENYQISEKNLINLSKGKINHAKILQKIYNQKKLISLEMSNIDIRLLEKDINKFQNIILSVK
tara:strand:+ start:3575 stop:4381 length:807 start_codon:yes stop_codon:yes gene_type:complete